MVQALPETGLLKVLTCRELRPQLHKATRESIEVTWLVWVSCHFNLKLEKVQIHLVSLAKNSSTSIHKVATSRLARM